MLGQQGSNERLLSRNTSTLVDQRDIAILDRLNAQAYQFYTTLAGACPGIKRIVDASTTLIEEGVINPILAGASAFFTQKNRRFRWGKPVADAIMIPGNAIITLSHLLPMNGKGQLGLIGAPTIAILIDLAYLISDATNTRFDLIHRIKNPIAAVSAILLGIYSALFMLNLTNRLLLDQAPVDEALTFNPTEIIDRLMMNHPTHFQKFILFCAGYVGAINGIVLGKDLVLYRAQAEMLRLWVNVRTRFLQRHLQNVDALQSLLQPERDKTAYETEVPNNIAVYSRATELEKAYKTAFTQQNDWYSIDIIRCLLAMLASIPAGILALPNELAQQLPLVQGPLEKNGLLPRLHKRKYLGLDETEIDTRFKNTSLFLILLAYHLGWIDKMAPQSEYKDKGGIPPPPIYDEMLHVLVTQDFRQAFGSLTLEAIFGFFTQNPNTPQQRMLERILQKSFLDAFANHLEGIPQNEPPMPKDKPPAYYDPYFLKKIRHDKVFKKMIKGEFNEKDHPPVLSFTEKAKLFFDFLYSRICTISPYTNSGDPSRQATPRRRGSLPSTFLDRKGTEKPPSPLSHTMFMKQPSPPLTQEPILKRSRSDPSIVRNKKG